MKKILNLLAALVASVSLIACHDELPAPQVEAERTVIIYMMAENSLAHFAQNDLEEMAGVASTVGTDVNVVIYVDDRSTPVIYTLTAKKGLTRWYNYANDQISTDSLTMLTTLRKIVSSFPAKTYSLTLWSHGTGWTPQSRTIGVDNGENSFSNSGLQMEVPTLRGVLEQLPHMEMVFFDACLMQSIEVAYELKDVTDYMVGSPSEIPGNGAPYHHIMPYLVKGDAEGVARAYYDYYTTREGVALGVVDCRQLDALAEVTAPLVMEKWQDRWEADLEGVQYYSPFSANAGHRPEPYDIEGVMHSQLSEDDFARWKRVWDAANVYCAATPEWMSVYGYGDYMRLTDSEHYSGMAMFVPSKKYAPYEWERKVRAYRWYRAAGWSHTGW